MSLNALVRAVGSIGSDPALVIPLDPWVFKRSHRLVTVGGVLVSGGETSVGVCEFSRISEVVEGAVWNSVVRRGILTNY